MNYPLYIEVKDKKYKINTSFKIAIKCNEIAKCEEIGKVERTLAIVYLLLGEEALEDFENYNDILRLIKQYLLCGKEEIKNDKEPDMDYVEDYSYIKTSFRSDYGMDIDKEDLHWWEFSDLMNGLSNSELGSCCILNRIRNLRNYDTSKVKDINERTKIEEAKRQVELKRNKAENHLTKEQIRSIEELNKIIGIE